MAKQEQSEPDSTLWAMNDQDAFGVLYDRYFKQVYNYVRFRVQYAYLADDLTSQVFENAWRAFAVFRSQEDSFKAWVFSIARNVFVDHYRREKRRNCVSLFSVEELACMDGDPLEDAIDKENYQELLKALAGLSDRERNIIALKFCAGLNNREISRLTDLKESHVGVILYRAMRRLKTLSAQVGGKQ